MKIPVALFMKKLDEGYETSMRNLSSGKDYSVSKADTVNEVFEKFEVLKDNMKADDMYDVVYVNEDIM